MPEVNWLAVIAAAVSAFVVGGIWYSPAMFLKAWQRGAGLSDEQLRSGNVAAIFGSTRSMKIAVEMPYIRPWNTV